MFIPPGYAQVTLTGTYDGSSRPWATSCGFAVAAWGPADMGDLQVYIGASDYVANASSDCQFRGLDVTIGTSDPSEPIHETAPLDFNGGEGAGVAPNSSYLVTKNTLRGGRKGRGRSFMPGPSEAGVGPGGNLTGDVEGTTAALEEFWMDIPSAVEALDGPYLLHTLEDTPDLIVSMIASTKLATQRRRLRK